MRKFSPLSDRAPGLNTPAGVRLQNILDPKLDKQVVNFINVWAEREREKKKTCGKTSLLRKLL